MGMTQDLLSPWSLPDDPFSLLGDFDHAATMELFGQFEQPAAACSDLGSNDAAPLQTSSDENNQFSDMHQSAAHKSAKAKEQAKELNRRAQKRHRDKQKNKWQRLEEELAASRAAATKLQADNKHLSNRNSLLEKVAVLQTSDAREVSVPAQVATRPTLNNSFRRVHWEADSWKSTVNYTEQTITVYQLGRMAPQQISIMWQDYIREMSICLALGPPTLSQDLDNPQGRRLVQLNNEMCFLCIGRARVDYEAHRSFLASPIIPLPPDSKEPDWLEVGHTLKLSDSQLRNVFLLRQAFLQKQAVMQFREQQLQLQLAAAPFDPDSKVQAVTGVHAAQQMQETTHQLYEAFMQYMGVIMDGVFSVWQAAMVIVSTFPHAPSKLTNIVEALALEAGEPTAGSFQTAAKADGSLELPSDSWVSLESHIYKTRMLEVQSSLRTAVAT